MQVETIYRAKTLVSDESITFKAEIESYGEVFAMVFDDNDIFVGSVKSDILRPDKIYCKLVKIDPSTRAIHFTNSNMNDSEGTPIFASLSSDGNGGSAFSYGTEIWGYCAMIYATPVIIDYTSNDKELPIWGLSTLSKVNGIHTVKETK